MSSPTSYVNPHPHTKYRPSFNMEQIQHIVSLTSTDSSLDLQVRKVLIPLLSKIEIGAISPSYKLSDTHTQKVIRKAETLRYEQGLMTPEEESAYERDVLGFIHTDTETMKHVEASRGFSDTSTSDTDSTDSERNL